MSYSNPLVKEKILTLISRFPNYYIAGEEDDEFLHSIIESSPMVLGSKLKVLYSRRPNFIESFIDSSFKPMILMNIQHSLMAIVSESKVYLDGIKSKYYYSSDLRTTSSVSRRALIEFREIYPLSLTSLDSDCYTSVLKENKKALAAFSSKRFPLKYNTSFEYINRILIILPGLNKADYQLKKVKAKKFNDYFNQRIKDHSFSHCLNGGDYFFLKRGNQIKASFSVKRPMGRNLLVESKSVWINLSLRLMRIFNRDVNEGKLPWVYIGHIIINEQNDKKENIISQMVKHLRKEK